MSTGKFSLINPLRLAFRHQAMIAAGSLLVLAAAVVSNGALERALLSNPARTLGWGATLFRVLLAFHGGALILAGLVWSKSRADALPKTRRMTRLEWAVLVGLSLLALGLRLWRLDSDLWHDEVLTLVDFARMPLGEIVTSFPSQNQHMLFSLLAHFSLALFGESAWALRLPSVLFGVGSIWALFLLGRRLMDTRAVLLACGLMTVSYHHIWFSQNARGYMGLLFFTVLSTWLWLEALERRAWRLWLGYAVAVALGAWLHLTMVFVVAAHALISLPELFKPAAETAVRSLLARIDLHSVMIWVLCASLTLQLHALALPEFLQSGLNEVSLPSEWTNPLWVITESLRSLRIGFSGLVVVMGGAALIVVGWWSLTRRDWRAALALVLPAALAGAVMLALGHNLWPRFFFFSMGFGLLIVVRGAIELPSLVLHLVPRWERTKRERLASVVGWVLVGLIIAASAATVPRNYQLPKQDFTGARDYVERHRQSGDAVVAVGLAGMDYGRYFAPHWSVADALGEQEAIQQAHATVWLGDTLPIQVKAYRPEIWRVIERDYKIIKVFPGTLGGGEIYVCRRQADFGFWILDFGLRPVMSGVGLFLGVNPTSKISKI